MFIFKPRLITHFTNYIFPLYTYISNLSFIIFNVHFFKLNLLNKSSFIFIVEFDFVQNTVFRKRLYIYVWFIPKFTVTCFPPFSSKIYTFAVYVFYTRIPFLVKKIYFFKYSRTYNIGSQVVLKVFIIRTRTYNEKNNLQILSSVQFW